MTITAPAPGEDITDTWTGGVTDCLNQLTNVTVFNAFGTASLAGSTSANYVDVGNTSFAWTKQGGSTDSDVIVLAAVSCYISVAATAVNFAVSVAGTDNAFAGMNINPANTHTTLVGFAKATGVDAGPASPKLRFKRTGGTGAVTIDTGDYVAILVGELPK